MGTSPRPQAGRRRRGQKLYRLPRDSGLEFISHHTLCHLLLHVVLAVGDQDYLIADEAVFSLAVHGREHDANTF